MLMCDCLWPLVAVVLNLVGRFDPAGVWVSPSYSVALTYYVSLTYSVVSTYAGGLQYGGVTLRFAGRLQSLHKAT